MIQVALLPLILAASTANTAVAVAQPGEQSSVQTVADDGKGGEELGFMEKHYPLSFSKNLEAETDDKFVILYVSGFLTTALLANVWLPILTVGNPGDYLVDALIGTIVHYVPVVCFPLAPLVILANALYLMPVHVVNTFDRNLKQAKKEGSWKAAQHEALQPRTEALAMAY
ncbi:MAG: hypothetical protein ACO3JL_05170 [Myxococcota bacterium]